MYEETPVAILLASADESNIRRIERELLNTASRTCVLNRCASLAEAEQIIGDKGRTDILVLDLKTFGSFTPDDIYGRIESFPAHIPVVIFTKAGNEENDLALSATGEEFSHIICGRFGRLPEAISFSLLRKSRRDYRAGEAPKGEKPVETRIVSWVAGDH